jgi:hypothetical protein
LMLVNKNKKYRTTRLHKINRTVFRFFKKPFASQKHVQKEKISCGNLCNLWLIKNDMGEKWLYAGLTQEVIGTAMEVHRELGSGFLE